MDSQTRYVIRVALTVAIGGFLMGFDASVISGVVGFIGPEFNLSELEIGWAVASLTLTATLAMMLAGPASDRWGRKPILTVAAILFALSAIASALAPDYMTLVAARMLGGFGVGAALIIAPMYIAEIAPADSRGKLVSFNQLNIVVGISTAYFSNYLILGLGQSDLTWALALGMGEHNWRWMLGVEALPALFYLLALRYVPESPRWLAMHGREADALEIMGSVSSRSEAESELESIRYSIRQDSKSARSRLGDLFQSRMKLVLLIGVSVAILQQITGINAVFFYAPMIFEQSGIGTDAAFMQAVLVGLVNLVFTILAIMTIDKLGRRPLLLGGLAVIAISMLTLSWAFGSASYSASGEVLEINATLVLVCILSFVAGFAISLGPVMWVLFSELFPNKIRGIAISFVGLINSSISFLVQLVFPWELANLGSAKTFLIYGVLALVGLVILARVLPETKGRTLEELEAELVRTPSKES